MNLVLWKDSFEKMNKELDLAKKKREALNNLYSTGRISQHTYDYISKGLNDEIVEIEARQKALAEKMTYKLSELEQQIKTLEVFLVNAEMSYAAGEITDELHTQEINALNLGLEATQQELNFIKDVIIQLIPKEAATTSTQTPVETVETTPTETAVEKAPEVTASAPIEAPTEVTPVSEEAKIEQPAQVPMEASTETPVQETQTEPIEGGTPPFRGEGEETTTEEEKKEG